jgi:hypothetical protein
MSSIRSWPECSSFDENERFSLTGTPKGQGFIPQSFRGMSGFCRVGENDTCDETDHGGFAHGASWFFGSRAGLEAMAPSRSDEALHRGVLPVQERR